MLLWLECLVMICSIFFVVNIHLEEKHKCSRLLSFSLEPNFLLDKFCTRHLSCLESTPWMWLTLKNY